MRFILVECKGPRQAEFPDHVQYRATCAPLDIFFWLHAAEGIEGARAFVRKRYPDATFSDQEPVPPPYMSGHYIQQRFNPE